MKWNNMLLADIHDTVTSLTTLVTVLSVAVPTMIAAAVAGVIKIIQEFNKLKQQTENTFHGQMERGKIEAKERRHVYVVNDCTVISLQAKLVFDNISAKLISLYYKVKKIKGSDPDDDDIGFALEQDRVLQDWIIKNACEALNLKAYGCLAVACAITKEYVKQFPSKPPSELFGSDKETLTTT